MLKEIQEVLSQRTYINVADYLRSVIRSDIEHRQTSYLGNET